MYRGRSVGVVVPAYNEEGYVGEVITSMPKTVDRVYVVDDASTDGTWEEIHAAAAAVDGPASAADSPSAEVVGPASTGRPGAGRTATGTSGRGVDQLEAGTAGDPRGATAGEGERRSGVDADAPDSESAESAAETGHVRTSDFEARVVPLRHETNRGVGGAIKTGYRRALADGVELVAVMGGDGQMNPDDLPRYLDPLVDGEADYVKGNRFMADDIHEMPRFRRLGNALLSLLTKIASGYWTVGDPQNGYTAATSDALLAVDLDGMYEYYGYCNDLLVKLNGANQRVADVPRPSAFNYDGEWKSHITYSEYVPRVSMMLFRNFLGRLRREPGPVAAAYVLGALLAAVGVALTAGRRPGGGPAAVAGVGLLAVAAALDHRRSAHLGRRLDPDTQGQSGA